jgi:hypothetical protein
MKKPELLTKPFSPDQIRERPGQHGKTLRYVDVAAVIERLNEAFSYDWSFEVVQHQIQDGETIVLGKLTADGVVKSAFGGSNVTTDRVGNVVSLADDLKAASSDALKKAASMFGIALDLYGGHRETIAAAPTPQPRQSTETAASARPVTPNDRVTARQLGAIHVACREQGLARSDVESMVEDRTGQRELGQLSRVEASRLIDELRGTGHGNGAAPPHA